MRLVVPCPAKVNLFLAVGPIDRRGYHPLRTVFQAISLFDEVEVDTDGEPRVTSTWPGLPAENTVTKAVRMMSELLDVPPLRIHIKKEIPAQSGLGGGSSDAAGVIRAIDRLMGNLVPEHELRTIAKSVGADVPFFLVGGKAQAEGYGERLTALPDPPREWLLIAKAAGEGTSTPGAFAALDEKPYEWRDFPAGDELYNDFERVADCAVLERIERLLVFGARDAGLTGSGSAVFGRYASEAAAERAKDRLAEEQPETETRVVHTLTRPESLRFL